MQLKQLYPEGRGSVVHDRLVWFQHIRPHILFHEYLCRFEYSLGRYPRVYVIDPALSQLAGGRDLPHVRSSEEPVALCLFVYDEACWSPDMLLGKVVVPMAFFWLACFEDWLFSGEWRGGGTHPITPCPPTTPPVFPADLDERQVA
jgi:hypothetical protein